MKKRRKPKRMFKQDRSSMNDVAQQIAEAFRHEPR